MNGFTGDRLNGGRLAELAEKDWELILSELRWNERLFVISVEEDLATVDGEGVSAFNGLQEG